jgi:ribosomal protein L10
MPTKADADSAQLKRKATVIEEIRTRLSSADAAVLTEYRGLTVSQIATLRAALRPAADYSLQNTLARRAASARAGHGAGSRAGCDAFVAAKRAANVTSPRPCDSAARKPGT